MFLRAAAESHRLRWWLTLALLPVPVSAEVSLTAVEQRFLDQLPVIKMCGDPDWMPYDGVDADGNHTGIMADFHKLWSEKLNKPVELVPTDDWQQSLAYIQQHRCDILTSAQDTPDRRDYLSVTQPFIFYPFAIATQPDAAFVLDLKQLDEREILMVGGYAGIELLRRAYPALNIKTVASAREGLKKVERGQAFAYIDTVPSINYQMFQHGISHLKISGVLDQQYAMSVGVRKDMPELLSAYRKAVQDTSESERQQILNNWLSLNYLSRMDYTLLWQILAVVFVIVAFLVYRYRTLNAYNQRLQQLNARLEEMSYSDQMTGVANRHRLHARFHAEIARAGRTGKGFAVVMLDLDHFKAINDQHGHDTGDKVLCEFAKRLVDAVREYDLVGRWGGEEFLIICPETDGQAAEALGEAIRNRIADQDFALAGQLTVSVGVTEYRLGEAVDSCIKRADQALYQAKWAGRNQTVTV